MFLRARSVRPLRTSHQGDSGAKKQPIAMGIGQIPAGSASQCRFREKHEEERRREAHTAWRKAACRPNLRRSTGRRAARPRRSVDPGPNTYSASCVSTRENESGSENSWKRTHDVGGEVLRCSNGVSFVFGRAHRVQDGRTGRSWTGMMSAAYVQVIVSKQPCRGKEAEGEDEEEGKGKRQVSFLLWCFEGHRDAPRRTARHVHARGGGRRVRRNEVSFRNRPSQVEPRR